MLVTLPPDALARAKRVGLARYRESVSKNMKDTRGIDSKLSHVIGACGEIAFSRAADIEYVETVNTFKYVRDVGSYEVRTRTVPNGSLILRTNDDDTAEYVLVVLYQKWDCYKIVGSILAADGKQPQFWHEDRGFPPAWFVPQRYLTPFSRTRRWK